MVEASLKNDAQRSANPVPALAVYVFPHPCLVGLVLPGFVKPGFHP